MPEIAADSVRQLMKATGISNPVMEWGQNAEGKRMKTETQERDPDTGMPKWDVEVMYTGSNFGQECTITANVTVGAPEKPAPTPMTPITFEGLWVSVFKNRAGGIAERWEAESIADMESRSKPASPSTTNSSATSSSKSSSSSASAA